jgi:hypothetical protein
MYDEKTVQRFIDLRVQGWSFARIALEFKDEYADRIQVWNP